MEDKIEQPWLNRDNWGEGEWQNEPDTDQFLYRYHDCLVLRNDVGALCGYVRVPKNSRWTDFSTIQVHGNITYSSLNEDGDRWIGFDCCGHADFVPGIETEKNYFSDSLKAREEEMRRMIGDPLRIKKVYRNMDYVINQCMDVVDQLCSKKRVTSKMSKRRSVKKKG